MQPEILFAITKKLGSEDLARLDKVCVRFHGKYEPGVVAEAVSWRMQQQHGRQRIPRRKFVCEGWSELLHFVEMQDRSGQRMALGSDGENSHSMLLTVDGQVLSFGWGGDGRLGHGNKQQQLVPKRIAALEGVRVCQVAAGDKHSMLLTADGQVLSFGAGEDGQLGHGDADGEQQLVPKQLQAIQSNC